MRIAVIAPPYPLEEIPAPPLGVCYVAAAFEKAGAEVRIFDYVVSGYSREKLRRQMDAFQPHALGSTSVTLNYYLAAQVLTDAKEIDPSVLTLMGGPHVSFRAEETLREYPAIDMIVMGEGEQTIAELVPGLESRPFWAEVKGVAFRKDGAVHLTGPRELIRDLDTLPLPARHLLPLSRYKALGYPVSITTSRGCPHECIFCQGRRMVGSRVRYRDVGLVLDEIEAILAWGFDRINFADDLFTANKKRVERFCKQVRERGLRFGWSAFSRVDTLDRETAEMMVATGCDWVSFGLESGNQEILDRIRKRTTVEQARKAVALCKEVGLQVHASFIVGLPGETRETMRETDDFARSLGISYGYHYLTPFPGTPVMEQSNEYDLEVLTGDWSLYDANRPVVRTAKVSPEDQIRFVRRHEQMCDELWAELERGQQEGTNTAAENARVEGRRRLGLVFRILHEDLIEECGAVPPDLSANGAGAFNRLVTEISKVTARDEAVVAQVVGNYFRRGLVEVQSTDCGMCWGWTPNPRMA